MTDPEDFAERLARLSSATQGLRPSAGFSARVMLAVNAAAAPSFFQSTWLSARRLLPLAVVTAALSVVWAVQVDGTVDDELASSYAALELE